MEVPAPERQTRFNVATSHYHDESVTYRGRTRCRLKEGLRRIDHVREVEELTIGAAHLHGQNVLFVRQKIGALQMLKGRVWQLAFERYRIFDE